MIEPIVLEFEVAAPPRRAFSMWTESCGLWWPTSHTMSEGNIEVVFQPFVGGRVYERGDDGVEHDWGEVTVWEPPHRLEYLWHIFVPPERATTVKVLFTAAGRGTAIRLENSGFEVFGVASAEQLPRVASAWEGITGYYRAAV